MRLLFALFGLLMLTAAVPARNWATTVNQTPAGAFVIGNPNARVKLVEYASFTCPHCAAFQAESAPVLAGRMIPSGSTSWEVRHLIRDKLDLAAVVLARCGGARRFPANAATIFAAQRDWLPRGIEFQEANDARLRLYPPLAQLRAYADGAGLTALLEAHGLTPAAVDACFADQADIDRVVAMTANLPADVLGTPAFFVNGKLVHGAAWPALEPVLQAQGAH